MTQAEVSFNITVFERGKRAPQFELNVDPDGEADFKNNLLLLKDVLISTAKTVLKEEQSIGFDKNPVIKIDNRFGKTEAQVNPLGQIEYIARQDAKDILIMAYRLILEKSRVLTGRYLRSNVVLFNGSEVANDWGEFEAWIKTIKSFKESDTVIFVNTAPYANKLELDGVTKEKGINRRIVTVKPDKNRQRRVRKPNGVYHLTYRALRRKYKNNSIIREGVITGDKIGLTNPEKGSGIGRIRQLGPSKGRAYVYPTITIYLKEAGIINE